MSFQCLTATSQQNLETKCVLFSFRCFDLKLKLCRTGHHTLCKIHRNPKIMLTYDAGYAPPISFSELLWSNICILHLKTWVNFPVSCAALFQDPLQQAAHLELHILLIKDSLNALDIQCGYQIPDVKVLLKIKSQRLGDVWAVYVLGQKSFGPVNSSPRQFSKFRHFAIHRTIKHSHWQQR